MKWTGENRSTWGKTCPSATLSTTNPTWTDPGSNSGLRGGRSASNRLSHGTAKRTVSQLVKKFPAYCETQRFITAFTTVYLLSLPWARSVQSTPSHPTSVRSNKKQKNRYTSNLLWYLCLVVYCLSNICRSSLRSYAYVRGLSVDASVRSSLTECTCTSV
jgi:hypothetical protein